MPEKLGVYAAPKSHSFIIIIARIHYLGKLQKISYSDTKIIGCSNWFQLLADLKQKASLSMISEYCKKRLVEFTPIQLKKKGSVLITRGKLHKQHEEKMRYLRLDAHNLYFIYRRIYRDLMLKNVNLIKQWHALSSQLCLKMSKKQKQMVIDDNSGEEIENEESDNYPRTVLEKFAQWTAKKHAEEQYEQENTVKLSKQKQMEIDHNSSEEMETEETYPRSVLEKLTEQAAKKREEQYEQENTIKYSPKKCDIFVCNLPWMVRVADVRKKFRTYGHVQVLMMSLEEKHHQNFEEEEFSGMAFMTFRQKDSIERLMNDHRNNPIKMGDRILKLKRWLNKDYKIEDSLIVSNQITVYFNHTVSNEQIENIFKQFGRIKAICYNKKLLTADVTFAYYDSVDRVLLCLPLDPFHVKHTEKKIDLYCKDDQRYIDLRTAIQYAKETRRIKRRRT
ncbi:unnamed protein product [Didymodactylos carnosus]|uniref:RRM domain-containing protein n=1 Tax=Didymodactylos carnosus TaxID=1234261 RepID=A0A815JK82_9BILA|nr:unnamed protein product [Didymodactylos carnosus]CAF4278409.1 unnamed protein product [Didymodactylos carnosus]